MFFFLEVSKYSVRLHKLKDKSVIVHPAFSKNHPGSEESNARLSDLLRKGVSLCSPNTDRIANVCSFCHIEERLERGMNQILYHPSIFCHLIQHRVMGGGG